MSRNFPASEIKLTALREKGIFPRSVYLQKTFRFFALLVSLYFILPKLFILADYKEFFSKPESVSIESVTKFYVSLILFPLLALLVSFLMGLFQTRFFFSPSLSAFDFARLKFFNFRTLNLTNIFAHFLLVAAFTLVVSYAFYESLLDLLVITVSFDKIKAIFLSQNLEYLVFFIILGLFSYLLNWLYFRKSQMMTREEVEAEHREQQSPYRQRGSNG